MPSAVPKQGFDVDELGRYSGLGASDGRQYRPLHRIVLDGYVYSAPVVRQKIEGGSSEISGNFTIQEAKDLANVLKSGKVPLRHVLFRIPS